MEKYVVTGVTTDGHRFRRTYTGPTAWLWANGINLYRGHVWRVDPVTGKRRCVKSVWN